MMEETAATGEETITVVRDHRAAIRTVMEETAATRKDNNRGDRPQGGYQNRDGKTAAIREEITVVRDHRAVIRTVTADHRAAAIRTRGDRPQGGFRTVGTDHRGWLSEPWRQTTGRLSEPMADHRAVSRTVTEIKAALAPVSRRPG